MARYSILVVEDEHTLRRLLEYRLSKYYRVRSAANGEEALQLVLEEIPDLIISDIMMPKMDGFALQQALQNRKETRAIPFIFLTAKADEHSRMRGMRMGVDDYITKPFDIDQLLARIERLLERTKYFQSQLDARIGQDFSKKLMPKQLPSVRGYRLYFHNSPKEYGGGDFFDWTQHPSGSFFITIGDVMGKGLQAKFYAFSFLSYIRGTLYAMLQTSQSPAELLRRVNHVLMQDTVMEETFASLLILRWDPTTHEVTYANAGHCRPILVKDDRTAEVVEYSDLILGLDPNATFQDATITIPAGGGLLLYTDGLLEQRTASGEMIGEQGLCELAPKMVGAEDPVQTLLQGILSRCNSDTFDDDILFFWMERLS
ncbi:PP2C family protein-serine/threonine phosphatase [Rhodothermus marinus]|uniref:Response regulator receiver modulated serine phosphatase n=1 Tax=Rhodothermus marinus (strain ATCC 43812 / DSM 4252 / R-10) TaxID=518766 RepID=D0MFG2_RHOM4|nr:SpoIIE family protein phosphatase [Rhodothermus marinus]ACY47489.1 response regulator receiver modulated serine phosphatase [Rhodothermus marinus DSM 4252]